MTPRHVLHKFLCARSGCPRILVGFTSRHLVPSALQQDGNLYLLFFLLFLRTEGVNLTIIDLRKKARGRRQRAILAYEISWFLFDFPGFPRDFPRKWRHSCKSGWGWRVGL